MLDWMLRSAAQVECALAVLRFLGFGRIHGRAIENQQLQSFWPPGEPASDLERAAQRFIGAQCATPYMDHESVSGVANGDLLGVEGRNSCDFLTSRRLDDLVIGRWTIDRRDRSNLDRSFRRRDCGPHGILRALPGSHGLHRHRDRAPGRQHHSTCQIAFATDRERFRPGAVRDRCDLLAALRPLFRTSRAGLIWSTVRLSVVNDDLACAKRRLPGCFVRIGPSCLRRSLG